MQIAVVKPKKSGKPRRGHVERARGDRDRRYRPSLVDDPRRLRPVLRGRIELADKVAKRLKFSVVSAIKAVVTAPSTMATMKKNKKKKEWKKNEGVVVIDHAILSKTSRACVFVRTVNVDPSTSSSHSARAIFSRESKRSGNNRPRGIGGGARAYTILSAVAIFGQTIRSRAN